MEHIIRFGVFYVLTTLEMEQIIETVGNVTEITPQLRKTLEKVLLCSYNAAIKPRNSLFS